jgi:hypothetical protein
MEYDHTSAERKRAELIQMALSALPPDFPHREKIAERIVGAFIQITPPANEPARLDLLTIPRMGAQGGSSRKPGNIFLNLRTLIEIVSNIALTVAGVAGQQWLIPLAGLHILNTLYSNSTVELDRNHAMAIYAMWTNRNREDRISRDNALSKTNGHMTFSGFFPLNEAEFSKVIDDLCEMGCIEVENGMILLRERVKTIYE